MAGETPPFGLDELPVAALATSGDTLVGVNPAFEELTGWTASEVLGKTLPEVFLQLVAPRDRAELVHLARNREEEEPRRTGVLWCRLLSRSGDERPVRVSWSLLPNDVDSIVVLVDARPEAFGQEVTETLARVAGSLSGCATEGEVLQRAVDALAARGFNASVFLWDEDDPLLHYGPLASPEGLRPPPGMPRQPRELLTRMNPRFLERRAIFFQDRHRLVRESYDPAIAERLIAMLPSTRMVQAPLFVGEAPYGALFVVGDGLTPLVATALDLFSELVGQALEAVRLRNERAHRERLAALGEAAAVMAHEVRNPVGAIMNAVTLLERAGHPDPTAHTLLKILAEEAERLTQLVGQLLDVGRPIHARPIESDLEEVVKNAVRLLDSRGELGGRQVTLPATRDTIAWLDPALAELAIMNVVRNAIQSSAERGSVHVSIATSAERAVCVVEDDGPGIPKEILGRIGQPFVTTRATGTGVGLAVVRRILEASGGELRVADRQPQGARVELDFPRRAP